MMSSLQWSFNLAKVFIVCIVLVLTGSLIWSVVNLVREEEMVAFNGYVLGTSLFGMIAAGSIYYKASCLFT